MSQYQVPPQFNAGMWLAEHKRNVFRVIVPRDTPIERILQAEFWIHVANRLTKGDVIEVDAEDISFTATLKVVDCGPQYANVALVYRHDLVAKGEDPSRITIEFTSGIYRVMRDKRDVLKETAVQRDAERWRDDFLKPGKAA